MTSSSISLLIMLLIMIIIPTILYTFFFLINCPPNPFLFFQRRSPPSEEGDHIEEDDSNKIKNDFEIIKMSSNLGEDDEKECSICLSVFVEGEQLRKLKKCKHLFHKVCIDKWLSIHFNCPVCRAFVSNHCKSRDNGILVLASRDVIDRGDFWQGLPDSAGLV